MEKDEIQEIIKKTKMMQHAFPFLVDKRIESLNAEEIILQYLSYQNQLASRYDINTFNNYKVSSKVATNIEDFLFNEEINEHIQYNTKPINEQKNSKFYTISPTANRLLLFDRISVISGCRTPKQKIFTTSQLENKKFDTLRCLLALLFYYQLIKEKNKSNEMEVIMTEVRYYFTYAKTLLEYVKLCPVENWDTLSESGLYYSLFEIIRSCFCIPVDDIRKRKREE